MVAIVLLLAGPAHAEDKNTKQKLNDTIKNIEISEARKKKFAVDADAIKIELKDLQKELVKLASKMQDTEQKLSVAETKLAGLEAQAKEKMAAKILREKQLAVMVQSMIRLSRTPPEAVIAMPGDYATILKTAKVLGVATDGVREQAEIIQKELIEIEKLHAQMQAVRDKLAEDRERLQKSRAALSVKLKAREQLQEKLYSAARKESAHIAQLSKQAVSLKELLANLEDNRARSAAAKNIPTGKIRSFAHAEGDLRQPSSGILIKRYGQRKGENDTSKGMIWRTRDNAQVIAPFDGQVVFTGPFMEYGRMVIIRHTDGYHTLVAGLERVDCKPGQFLLEGEPIGAMGKSKSGNGELYFELRKDNKPIDPSGWLKTSSRKR